MKKRKFIVSFLICLSILGIKTYASNGDSVSVQIFSHENYKESGSIKNAYQNNLYLSANNDSHSSNDLWVEYKEKTWYGGSIQFERRMASSTGYSANQYANNSYAYYISLNPNGPGLSGCSGIGKLKD